MIQRMLVLLGLAAAASATAAPLADGDPEAGADKATVCASCHGAGGNSTNPAWPKLAGQHSIYIVEQLKLYKSGDRSNPVMQAQAANLSEQDMQDLAAYFSQQEAEPGVAGEDLLAEGKAFYYGGNPDEGVPACSGCHGPAGLGNAAAGFPRLAGQHADYVKARLQRFSAGDVPDTRNAQIMHEVSEGLTDENIRALAQYISGLKPRDQ